MSLFGLGKKKEEVKIEPACACNGEVATYEASSCYYLPDFMYVRISR